MHRVLLPRKQVGGTGLLKLQDLEILGLRALGLELFSLGLLGLYKVTARYVRSSGQKKPHIGHVGSQPEAALLRIAGSHGLSLWRTGDRHI